MGTDPQAVVHRALDRLAGDLPALGIAFSGGGDSTALLHMVHAWARGRGGLPRLRAATVDHGLRPDSRTEARAAGVAAAALGVGHDILDWAGPTGGNLMAQARDARLALLAGWAGAHGLPAVALGHTLDDQAETVLLRVMRGAGVDGLSGMADARMAQGVAWLRPMLDVGRADLRAWLRARGIAWTDDPSNDNAAFDRVRVRQAIAALDLSPAALARTAQDMRDARAALDRAARAVVADGCRADRGTLDLPRGAILDAPAELRRRIVAAALRWVTGGDYAPRRDPVARVLDAIAAGGAATLDGVCVRPRGDRVTFGREPAAASRAAPVAPPVPGGGAVWDRRWRVAGLPAGAVVTALPQAALPHHDWRAAGLTREQVAATPAVRLACGTLVAPVITPQAGITAAPLRDKAAFLSALSH